MTLCDPIKTWECHWHLCI